MNRIKELEDKIFEARNAYYNKQQTKVSDQVYDAWIDELKTLDPTNKSVLAIGSPIVVSEWKKANHQIPMGSLDKVNTPDELAKWANNIGIKNLFVTEKLDGLSIELIYEQGVLVQAITRGDGLIGEDITINVSKMNGVKNTILATNFTGSLRGEIIMKKSVHKQYFCEKANPRNAASGISKRLDGVGVEYLNVILYQVLGDIDFKTETDQFKWLEQYGFSVPPYSSVTKIDSVTDIWKKYQAQTRETLDYDIDGLVIRVEDLDLQAALGDKDMRPKGAIAFKFDSEARESVIRDIVWQVGNSGRLTPVATLDPVSLMGATVTRASLYNIGYIQELKLDIGATVLVVRANDVIPRVKELIQGTNTVAVLPTKCPDCNGDVLLDGENASCTNSSNCAAQKIGRIKNWIKELNLLEWGQSLIEKLVQFGKIKDIPDLYTLTVDDLASLERMGKKSAQKCYDILWQNNEIPLDIFLGALSIPFIGQSTIKLIINAGCDNLEKFGQLNADAFSQVPGLGPVKAKSLVDGLKNNKECILSILKNGVKIKEKVTGCLVGKSFAITGTLSIKRSEIENIIRDNGGEIKSSVGKGLSYLIISDPQSTSSKAQAARKLGTILINENDFLSMLK